MRILITGKGGNSGSWKIRAEQLGAAIGAEIQPLAEVSDCRNADVVVCVKRTPAKVIDAIRASGRPWVWDIVDGWPQPTTWGADEAIRWLSCELQRLRPTGVVFGTARMQRDAEFSGPSLVLPHHSWQRHVDRPARVRQAVESVGYEGAEAYLGRWRPLIEAQCKRRGWRFVVNGDLADCDIGIALRDTGGYPAAHWKPGTKLANLQAIGLPALCSPEEGYHEISSGAEFWVRKASDIEDAFDVLANVETRQAIHVAMRDSLLSIEFIASRYRQWLQRLV